MRREMPAREALAKYLPYENHHYHHALLIPSFVQPLWSAAGKEDPIVNAWRLEVEPRLWAGG